jgi:hypothetical protein
MRKFKSSYILILSLLFSFSCIKNKCPLSPEDSILKNEYIKSWPDSIICIGHGVINQNMPIQSQNAAALRMAKMDLYRDFFYIISELPISNTKNIRDLMIDNIFIQYEIERISKMSKINETNYITNGEVEIIGLVLTIQIKEIIIPYLLEVKK